MKKHAGRSCVAVLPCVALVLLASLLPVLPVDGASRSTPSSSEEVAAVGDAPAPKLRAAARQSAEDAEEHLLPPVLLQAGRSAIRGLLSASAGALLLGSEEPAKLVLGSQPGGPPGHLNPNYRQAQPQGPPLAAQFRAWFTVQCCYLALTAVIAYVYKNNRDFVKGPGPEERDFKTWTSRVIEPICCWSICCPSVRWADTMSMASIIPNFWHGFFLFFGVQLLISVLSVFGWIAMAVILTMYRTRMRQKFAMEPSYLEDCACLCCCLPCVVAQEARHVEEARAAGRLEDAVAGR
eukprot:TRINITY_DN46708_c0_g1_i1.p1 TRINITY_DN46708_c0_g1~~TRINITY_DN46708_c0_g1_i1.p1  ORF type:complete len:294 (-),score=61.74 TRINITY_DN46708_c0_g1_i1:61-942(-)